MEGCTHYARIDGPSGKIQRTKKSYKYLTFERGQKEPKNTTLSMSYEILTLCNLLILKRFQIVKNVKC